MPSLALCFLFACVLSSSSAVETQDRCSKQDTEVQKQLSNVTFKSAFVSEFIFESDTKSLLLMTWAGPHVLIVVTLRTEGLVTRESDVYRSIDDGKNFTKITGDIAGGGQLLVMQSSGLQRNPVDPSRIYLICYDPASFASSSSLIYYTTDSGKSKWRRASVPFKIQSQLQFHPTDPDRILVQSGSVAYVSVNGGANWEKLLDGVFKATWALGNDTAKNAVYAAVEAPGSGSYGAPGFLGRGSQPVRKPGRQLLKSDDSLRNWKVLAENIYSYSNKGEFVFVSKADSDTTDLRHLEVSEWAADGSRD